MSIKHPRNKSVLLHDDSLKLLHVSRRTSAIEVEHKVTESELWKEWVVEAKLIHEDVFQHLAQVFPDIWQLNRLLFLEGVIEWPGWAEIKNVLSQSSSDAEKRLHVEEFVGRFVRRCQTNCLYDGFPTDEKRAKNCKDVGLLLRNRLDNVVTL